MMIQFARVQLTGGGYETAASLRHIVCQIEDRHGGIAPAAFPGRPRTGSGAIRLRQESVVAKIEVIAAEASVQNSVLVTLHTVKRKAPQQQAIY